MVNFNSGLQNRRIIDCKNTTKLHCDYIKLLFYIVFADNDECSSNPCLNGQCTDLVNQFACDCAVGWLGVSCDRGEYQFGTY